MAGGGGGRAKSRENSFRGIDIFMFNRPGEGRKNGAAEKSRGNGGGEGAEPPEAAQKKDHCQEAPPDNRSTSSQFHQIGLFRLRETMQIGWGIDP